MDTSVGKKIFTNTVGQIILRSIEVVLGVITLGLITRYLGQEGYGHYTTVVAFLQLFIIIIDFGLYLTLLREISAKDPSETERITNNIFTLRLISSIIFLVLASVAVFATPYPAAVKWGVMASAGGFLFVSLMTTLTALFQKHLQLVRFAAVTALSKLLLLIFTVIVIVYDLGLQALFISSTASLFLGFLMIWALLSKLPQKITLRLRFEPAFIKYVIGKTWPIAVTTALNLIYFKADTIILSLYHSQEAVGLYGAGYRVVDIVTAFPHAFMGLIMPLLTAAWVSKNTDRLRSVWKQAFLFFTFLTLPLIAGAFVVGRDVMVLIAGSNFAISGDILKILVIAVAAIFFGTLHTYMVLVLDKQKQMIKYFLATAILAVIGYFVFIPYYSYWGAAWITVGSEILVIFSAWMVIRKDVSLSIPWGQSFRLLTASILMAVVLYFIHPYIPIIPLIVLGAIIYGVFALLLRGVSYTEIKQLIAR